MLKFKVYKDSTGEWRWNLIVSNNGNIVADSGESYKNRKDCYAAIDTIKHGISLETPVDQEYEVV